jgi:hypothetical protein
MADYCKPTCHHAEHDVDPADWTVDAGILYLYTRDLHEPVSQLADSIPLKKKPTLSQNE